MGRDLGTFDCDEFTEAAEKIQVLIVHLLKSVVALIVPPIDKHRSMPDARTIVSPPLEPDMGLRQGPRR